MPRALRETSHASQLAAAWHPESIAGVSTRLEKRPIGVGDPRQIGPVTGFTASRVRLGMRVLVLSLGRLSLATRCENPGPRARPFPFTDQPCPKDLARLVLLFWIESPIWMFLWTVPDAGWPAGTWRGEQAPETASLFVWRSAGQGNSMNNAIPAARRLFHGVAVWLRALTVVRACKSFFSVGSSEMCNF